MGTSRLPSTPLSARSAEGLVCAFEDCTLPREEWTHAAHLVVGLWYVLHHGRGPALELTSTGIERYNRASGRTPRERNGFDARVTRIWIERIADFVEDPVAETLDDQLLSRMLSFFLGRGEASRRAASCPAGPAEPARS